MSKKRVKKRKKGGKKSSKPRKRAKAAKKPAKKALGIKRPRVIVKKVRYVVESVPEQYIFHLQDGRVLRNLTDLVNALDTMSDEIFYFHANDDRNDFSNWISDIIDENELSLSICGKSRLDTKNEIIRFLKKRGTFKG